MLARIEGESVRETKDESQVTETIHNNSGTTVNAAP